ncbi:MAG: restriction endonuclease [Candidatus Helarchaeota archaeon]
MHTLKELVYSYFKNMGYNVQLDITVTGTLKNNEYHYDMVCTDIKNKKIGIVIKDWGRSIGINAIRHFHEQIENSNLSEGILVGRSFSGYAKNLSKDYYKVKTLSRNELIYHLGL